MTLKKFQCAVSHPTWVRHVIHELVPYSPVRTVFHSPNVKRVIQQQGTYDKYWSQDYCEVRKNFFLGHSTSAFEGFYSIEFPGFRKSIRKIQGLKILYNISKRK